MNTTLETQFQEAVTLLVDEGWPVERILARDPATAAELRPLLQAAARLTQQPVSARADARARSRRAFLEAAGYAADQPAVTAPAAARRPEPSRADAPAWLTPIRSALASLAAPRLRPVTLAIGMVAGLAVVGAQAVRAAERALPGDPLYAVKESTRAVSLLWLSTDDVARARKAVEIEAARRGDVVAALRTGRMAEVRFSGQVEAYSAETCVISGITVALPAAVAAQYADAEGGAGIRVGQWIMVDGRMAGGILTALAVDHVSPSFVIPPATPTAADPAAPTARITAPVAPATATPPAADQSAEPPDGAPEPAGSPIGATGGDAGGGDGDDGAGSDDSGRGGDDDGDDNGADDDKSNGRDDDKGGDGDDDKGGDRDGEDGGDDKGGGRGGDDDG